MLKPMETPIKVVPRVGLSWSTPEANYSIIDKPAHMPDTWIMVRGRGCRVTRYRVTTALVQCAPGYPLQETIQ